MPDTLTVTMSSGWGNSVRDGFIAGLTVLIGVLVQESFTRYRKRNEEVRKLSNEIMRCIGTLISESDQVSSSAGPKSLSLGSSWWEAQFELRSRLRLVESSVTKPLKEKSRAIKDFSQDLIAMIGVLENELGKGEESARDSMLAIVETANSFYSSVFGDGKVIRDKAAKIAIEKKLNRYRGTS